MDADVSIAVQNLTYELARVSKESSAVSKIRRVPQHLRTENVKAYEPQIIAIGPLNCHLLNNKILLAEMQKPKVLYLKKLLQRRGEDLSNLERYLVATRELEEKARFCYAEPIHMYRFKFLEMLLLDACFIVELFRKFKLDLWDDDDDVFQTSWVRKKLGRDLLLADNQLPLFVLQEFFDATKMPEDKETNFQDLILSFLSKALPLQLLKVSKIGLSSDLDPNIKHLLGFIHNYVPRIIRPAYAENWNFIVCATNLKEAGIKFEKIEGESLLSIDFDKDAGILKIPTLTIDDDTESFFRNISVYEQFFPIDAHAPFINYLKFMDCLINTAKDVELLCENKILHNCLGDDEVVANMFNRLGDSVALPLYNFYGDIFHNVNKYCDRHWNIWIANLRHNYFNTPWTIISVFAALFLLILTLTQTLFSVLAYFQ
ncbi:hypothetical protein CICLE_v10006434mg [Citrus x clementina]|uniref:Uncharacterized protein n=1 Tax=Citrus clementina TaxID=85681 RepID=V4S1I7_CITCL|nr:hypothetical protein CICLE_v10006434mg [Citrus x clementina]